MQTHAVELQARHGLRERLQLAFPVWRERLGDDHMLDIRSFGAIGDTAMTSDRTIEMTTKGLPSTFVPGRNLVFLIYAAALADRRGLTALVGGMCETDYSGYPDCRRDTLDATEQALNLGMEQAFRVETPLMRLTKAETWGLAKTLGGEALIAITVEASHTCYMGERGALHAWGYGCGQCPACKLRQGGYETWDRAGRPEFRT